MTRLLKSGAQVLEIGCGDGYVLSLMKKKYPKCIVSGVDISETSVSMAKKRGLSVDCVDVEKSKIGGSYDLIYGTAVLHHLVDIRKVADKMFLSVKDGGVVIFGPEPDRFNFLYLFWHLMRCSLEVEKGQLNISKKNLVSIFKAAGFSNVSCCNYGNIFFFYNDFILKILNYFGILKLPVINDLYIYAEK